MFKNICDLQEDWSDELELPDIFVESDQIDWQKRIDIQAAIQKSIDHSISSTINLPKGTDPVL
jgi:ribonucleotide reductase alpha subunit